MHVVTCQGKEKARQGRVPKRGVGGRPAGATATSLAEAGRTTAIAVIFGRVELRHATLTRRITTMTNDKIALRELLEKGSDASFLREMIGLAAQRVMELETEALG